MRYYINFIINCFLVVNLTAQEVPLIHTTNVFWEYNDWGGNREVKSRIHPIGDTIILDQEYIVFRNENYTLDYPAKKAPPPHSELSVNYTYIRVSEGKLYRREIDYNANDYDKLIFDSSWSVGDTIEVFDLHTFQLVSIDSVFLGGMDRRRWTFENMDYPDSELFTGIFIEGIGGLYGRLDKIPIGGAMLYDEYDSHNLDCFTLNGEWITGDNCELGTAVHSSIQAPKVTIHVDPTNYVLQIQSDLTFSSGTVVKIYDIQGRIVYTRMIHASTTRIAYPAELYGIYLVEVSNEVINYHQKILIR